MRRSLLEPWGLFLQDQVEKLRPGTREQLKASMHWLPERLRIGRWAWAPTLVYWGVLASIVCSAPAAAQAFEPLSEAPGIWYWRLAGSLYGLSVMGWVFSQAIWPLCSWTMLGWVVATMRYLMGVLGLRYMQRALTFPSLLANTVTVSIWYAVLVPAFVAGSAPRERWNVVKFWVFKPMLITVHGINFPFSVADWYMQPYRLELFDLWAGCAYGILYLTFYLFVLDQVGVHLYFILTPRVWWGAAVYAGILAIGLGVFSAFNAYVPSLL